MSISVPRDRMQDGVTGIRPLEAADLPALVEARIRNREFLTEWEPTRDESFYTPAGQARELALDDAAWRTATGFPFVILDASAGDRLIGRVALANVVRGVWQNATLGYWVSEDAGSRKGRRVSRGLRVRAHRCREPDVDRQAGEAEYERDHQRGDLHVDDPRPADRGAR